MRVIWHRRNFKFISFCTLLFLVLLIIPYSSYAKDNLWDPLTQNQIDNNKEHIKDAAKYAVYAILSNQAYSSAHAQLSLPENWKENKDLRIDDNVETGYAQAVFEKYVNSKLVEVVIAFRGTDDKKDWIQNIAPLHHEQTPFAEFCFRRVLEKYKNTSAKIVATGHSLGGGLAMNISFKYPNVDAVVFNSSPIAQPGLNPNQNNKRVSISESGEILEVLRDAVKERWINTRFIKFSFLNGTPVQQHDITPLAANLVKLGAIQSTELKKYLDSQQSK